jgi:uncharacterized repeat protein (TIGR03943 family)
MTASLQRYVSAGVLTIWGVMLGYFFFSGRVASYLHPSFHIWTAISGIVLVLLAAALVFLPEESQHECESCCDHVHDQRTPVRSVLTTAVLVLPLALAATISPDQFGAATVNNRGYIEGINDFPSYQPYVEPELPLSDDAEPATASPNDGGSYALRNAAGQIKAQTIDLLYAAEEPTMRADFEGKEVEVIGQFMPARENNTQNDRFNLVRMFIICCAADGRPVAITVQTNEPQVMPEMSWVRVTGTASFPIESGRRVPVLVANSVTPCEPPEETFIY